MPPNIENMIKDRKLSFWIAAGLGDNILLRMALDTVKHNFDEINISHNVDIVNEYRDGDPKYFKFLDDVGTLLFSEPPYNFNHNKYDIIYTYNTYKALGIVIKQPKLDHLLCKGVSLNLNQEYIVLTTKIRTLPKQVFYNLAPQFWKILTALSQKYKIVVLGEREMEGPMPNDIYSIYNDIIANLPKDSLIDLTVPALGVTAPELSKIQQDCLIMKNAKFVIANGIGGNVWMAAAVANTIGFRCDEEQIINLIVQSEWENIFITKDQSKFIKKLEEYLH